MTERTLGLVEAVMPPPLEPKPLEPPRPCALRARAQLVTGRGGGGWGEDAAFGPPDLCQVVKAWKGVGFSRRAYRQSFHHLLSGFDVSVEGGCAYFRELCDAVEPLAWLSMSAGEWAVEEAELCFYAAFSRADVRLRVRAPGAVTQLAVTADGTTMGCSAELWAEARLCSMLRSLEVARLGPGRALRG
eukprot:COSAG04_NODE_7225_length_1165_cov_1.742964_2_plen_187_part_01